MTKAIKTLESFIGLNWYAKAEILLTAYGYKPSTFIYLEARPYAKTGKAVRVPDTLVTMLSDLLTDLGLVFETRDRLLLEGENDSKIVNLVDFFISREKDSVIELRDAIEVWNEYRIGIALGYPQTAVEAYVRDDLLPMTSHPLSTEDVNERHMRMLGHRLSKNDWHHEVKYLQVHGEALKNLSRTIYNHVTA